MALTVNTNLASITAQKNLAVSSQRLESSVTKLSSGLRIASASDDAAGLVISEKMRAQIRSLQQAQRNSNDGVSLANTADGALGEISAMLARMRELSIQSLNGTNGTSERTALNTEYVSLRAEIDRISQVTAFNGVFLLNGGTAVVIQVGAFTTSNDRISIAVVDTTAGGLALDTTSVGGTISQTKAALAAVDDAISDVNSARGSFGSAVNRMNTTLAALSSLVQSTISAESRIRDADVASETAEFTRNQVLQSAGISVLAQANTLTQAALQLLRF